VIKGERWCLSGPNGAGKSTLLSLINADNPQAYANEIYLFDKRRGKGETIWDIKKRIGYVSPELHLFFDASVTTFDAIASGLFDTIGLFRSVNQEQADTVKAWMKLLNLEELSNRLLHSLPLGKQRFVLLARALVKNPPLLILDEPAQGLDEEQAALFKNIIEQICRHSDKTLIYVTHLKSEIPSCVRNFIQLEKGRIVNGNEGQ
jgi:molybdate transport system ATP-binding protein